jgi:hypothetical protein
LNNPSLRAGHRRTRRSRGRFFNIDLINKLKADSRAARRIANWSSPRFDQFV